MDSSFFSHSSFSLNVIFISRKSTVEVVETTNIKSQNTMLLYHIAWLVSEEQDEKFDDVADLCEQSVQMRRTKSHSGHYQQAVQLHCG